MFVEGISGTLMNVKKSNQTRFEFVVWFPFTRDSMKTIREGSLIAAKNFASDGRTDHYSIMRITSVLPTHYALGTGLTGYPGFVEEAAINASKDWSQEKPTEDTTKIVCEAIPSTFEIQMTNPLGQERVEPAMFPESNMPMTGERVMLLDADWTARIVNRDLQRLQNQTITLGKLANSDVDIMVLWDAMIRTHFGVFAYTNAGKSNLLSTVTAKIFEKAGDVKIVIYDLMGEYGILLIDALYNNPDACIVYLSTQAMPDSVIRFWRSDAYDDLGKAGILDGDSTSMQASSDLSLAARDIVNTTILPKALKEHQSRFNGPVEGLLRDGKIKLLVSDEPLGQIVRRVVESASRGSTALNTFVEFLQIETLRDLATIENIRTLLALVEQYRITGTSTATVTEVRNKLRDTLRDEETKLKAVEGIDPRFVMKMQDMVNSLNEEGKRSLYILQDSDDARVRRMSSELGRSMLASRRRKGRISPLVSFIYDEADQFIAQEDGASGMKESKGAAQELARRGRKYGLGIGIATQRIVYLDTSILGQPHTYLVSKLPRASDRERIQEAFGLSDETLSESLRFGVGQWLLISHSATGIDGLPMPIQLQDANDRIIRFLEGVRRE